MSDENKSSDLEAKLAKAIESIEKLEAKNKELLTEKQKAKEAADAAEAERETAEEEKARANNDLKALEDRLNAKHSKELAKLTKENEGYKGQLNTLLIENTIQSSMAEHNVLPQFQKAVAAMIRAEAKLENGEAMAAGMSLKDYIADFVGGDDGKHFTAAPANTGAAVTNHGTTVSGGQWSTPPKSGQEMAEWGRWAMNNESAANTLADRWGMPHLKP